KPIPFGAMQKGLHLFSSPNLFRPSGPRRLRRPLGRLWCKVLERQEGSRLERLNSNVAADLAHDGHIQEFVDQKTLIVTEIGYDDLEEVIRLAGNEVARDNLRHRDNGLL